MASHGWSWAEGETTIGQTKRGKGFYLNLKTISDVIDDLGKMTVEINAEFVSK